MPGSSLNLLDGLIPPLIIAEFTSQLRIFDRQGGCFRQGKVPYACNFTQKVYDKKNRPFRIPLKRGVPA